MKDGARTVFQNNELLRNLGNAAVTRVAEVAVQRSYRRGMTIFSEGDPADAIFGVISGQVQITAYNTDHQEIILYPVDAGGIFGLNSLIDGSPRAASARASSRVFAFMISREQFLRLVTGIPELALHLIQLLGRRQQVAARMIIEEYSASKVSVRLAHRLLELTKANGQGNGNGDAPLAITQSDLAKLVFFSRQAVNQCLQQWHCRGWISASRGCLVINDRAALREIARRGDPDGDRLAFELLHVTATGQTSAGAAAPATDPCVATGTDPGVAEGRG